MFAALLAGGCHGGNNNHDGGSADVPASAIADYYVSPTGNDANPGTIDQPFLTLERGRVAATALWQTAATTSRTAPITVMLRDGSYYLSALAGGNGTQQFGAADSGSAALPIAYRNYPGETPIVSGGYRVTGWTNVTGNTWTVALPAAAVNFEDLYYDGVRRLRPRIGAGTSDVGGYLRVAANAQAMVYDTLQYDPADPIVDWANLDAPAGCGDATTSTAPVGDIELIYHELAGTSKLRIKCIDSANHLIYFTGRAALETVQHNRYIVENVRDALTQPGQWFLDRSTAPFTLTYLANPGEDPNTDSVIIPQLAADSPWVVLANGLHDVQFSGITFSHDNYVVPDAGYTYIRLDSTVSSAISCINCERVAFDSDVITHTSGAGIDFTTCTAVTTPTFAGQPTYPCPVADPNGATVGDSFTNGGIFDTGAHGIRIGQLALTMAGGDTTANLPQSIAVQDTIIDGVGRTIAKAFPIAQGCGHDNSYTHNELHDSYSGGINIGALNCPPAVGQQGSFNNVAANNLIYDLGQGISNDFGCLYFNVGTLTYEPAGNQAHDNICHDINDATASNDSNGFGGQGVYIDNFTGGVDVRNNLIYRVSGIAMNLTSGPGPASPVANTIENNIFAFARDRMIELNQPWNKLTCPGDTTLKFSATNNIFYFDRDMSSTPAFFVQGGCTYTCESAMTGDGGQMFSAYESFANNTYYRADGTFDSDTKAFHVQTSIDLTGSATDPTVYCDTAAAQLTFMPFTAWQGTVGDDLGSSTANPHFTNPTTGDFTFANGAPAGFTPIDFQSIGRTATAIAALPDHPVAATLPTSTFSPSDF